MTRNDTSTNGSGLMCEMPGCNARGRVRLAVSPAGQEKRMCGSCRDKWAQRTLETETDQ